MAQLSHGNEAELEISFAEETLANMGKSVVGTSDGLGNSEEMSSVVEKNDEHFVN